MRGTSWLHILIVIIMGSAVGIFGGTFLAKYSHLRESGYKVTDVIGRPFDGQRYVNILMLGEDNTARGRKAGHGLSDTLVVMAVDTDTGEVRSVSIPRDTMVEIPGHGTCKINSANVYGGPMLAKSVIENLLGIKIDRYVATTTQGLRGLVDMVGGVYVVIDKDMHYVDRHGGLYINFKASPEKQLLNGEQAEEYVRFRHDAVGDSGFTEKDGKKVPAGRTVRQQKFLRALANRILSMPTKEERLDALTRARDKEFIVSDMLPKDWKGLMDVLKDFDPEKMAMAVLPGAPGNIHGASYWLPDMEQVRVIVSQNLLFQGTPTVEEEKPKIEVLNGSGITGAARKVADKLRSAGFDIERTDNAPNSDYMQCCIITRKGKTSPVIDQIARLLNCSDIQEEAAAPGKPDITVIVGKGYVASL